MEREQKEGKEESWLEEYYKQPGKKSPLRIIPRLESAFWRMLSTGKRQEVTLGENLEDILAEDEAVDTLEALQELQKYIWAPRFHGRMVQNMSFAE